MEPTRQTALCNHDAAARGSFEPLDRYPKCDVSDVQEFRGGFSVFEAFGDHAKGKGLHARHGFVTVRAVAHHARQPRHFGGPAAVIFAIELNRKRHVGTVTFGGPAVWLRRTLLSPPRDVNHDARPPGEARGRGARSALDAV